MTAQTAWACGTPTALSASANGTTADLNWLAVASAGFYTLEIEDANNNPTPFFLEVRATNTTYKVAGLTPGQGYKFKVRANCGGDHSDWANWFFFTAGASGGGSGSGTCGIPTGLAVSVANNAPTLTWAAVTGATAYQIEIETEPSGTSWQTTVSGTTYTPTGLAANQAYKFKVRAVCGGQKSDWSPSQPFNGTSSPGGGSGSGGSCGIPMGMNALADANGVTLTWNSVPGAVSYSIEVENTSNNTTPFSFTVTVATNPYKITGLVPGKQYKFKVRANCANGHGDWSGWLPFNSTTGAAGSSSGNGACATPTGLTATTDPTTGAVTLNWNASTGALSYQLEIENASGNNTPFKAVANATTTTYTVTGLLAAKNYKFKVRAVCTGGHSNWTDWKTFNSATGTGSGTGGNTPNGSCALPAGLEATPSVGGATLRWAAVTGAVAYQVEVEQTNNSPFFFFSATVTAPTLNVTGLLTGKSYKFKVRAICANGKSDWSGWFTFAMPQNIQNKPATTTAALNVAVWPNPISDGLLQIKVEGATQEPIHLRFADAYGRMVTTQKQETVEDWALSFPLPTGLPEGVYYLQVVQAGKAKTITVLVKR